MLSPLPADTVPRLPRTRLRGPLVTLAAALSCATPPAPRYPAAPMASIQNCYTPGRNDYHIGIFLVPDAETDTTLRLTDTAYARTFLDAVLRRWPVASPLPRERAVIRVLLVRDGSAAAVRIERGSGTLSFDRRSVEAVRSAGTDHVAGPLPASYARDTLPLDIHFGVSGHEVPMAGFWLSEEFQARPMPGNPMPGYPAQHADGRPGRVVVTAMVDTLGRIDMSTVTVVAATDDLFVDAVLAVLPRWRFRPAAVRGCKVAREVRIPFDFGERAAS